jgi:hypothetical protein
MAPGKPLNSTNASKGPLPSALISQPAEHPRYLVVCRLSSLAENLGIPHKAWPTFHQAELPNRGPLGFKPSAIPIGESASFVAVPFGEQIRGLAPDSLPCRRSAGGFTCRRQHAASVEKPDHIWLSKWLKVYTIVIDIPLPDTSNYLSERFR